MSFDGDHISVWMLQFSIRVVGRKAHWSKYHRVTRKVKDTRSVVFCISKGYEAAEAALRRG